MRLKIERHIEITERFLYTYVNYFEYLMLVSLKGLQWIHSNIFIKCHIGTHKKIEDLSRSV